jgi:hypothetical protein
VQVSKQAPAMWDRGYTSENLSSLIARILAHCINISTSPILFFFRFDVFVLNRLEQVRRCPSSRHVTLLRIHMCTQSSYPGDAQPLHSHAATYTELLA